MSDRREWLVTDRTGAFALGCVDRGLGRKYHSALSIAEGLGPWSGKNLVLEFEERIEANHSAEFLAGAGAGFSAEPWPKWTYEAGHAAQKGGISRIEREIRPLAHSSLLSQLGIESGFQFTYSFSDHGGQPSAPLTLIIRPKLLSRPLHALKVKNPVLNGQAHHPRDNVWEFQLYPGEPWIVLAWEGAQVEYQADGRWEAVEHPWELERGYPGHEDCFVPGEFRVSFDGTHSEVEFSVKLGYRLAQSSERICVPRVDRVPQAEGADARRPPKKNNEDLSRFARLDSTLRWAAQSFLAEIQEPDGCSPTLLAGLPWFGPWARDLFVCLPGFALAAGRGEKAYALMASAGRGVLKSLLEPEAAGGINTHGADTPWLYLWALEHLIRQEALSGVQERVLIELGAELASAVVSGRQAGVIVEPGGGIRIEPSPRAQTWMDAVVEGRPVTPRHGYPVEINALMIQGLGLLVERESLLKRHPGFGRLREAYGAARERFLELFNPAGTSKLGDCRLETLDLSVRPNSLWAVALHRVPVSEDIALATLKTAREALLTPVGLRTLSPADRAYHSRCAGDQVSRDFAYHQGTVWPWLLGIYADAVVRWEGRAALVRDLKPALERLEKHIFEQGCIGQVSEIFDGDAPHEARGAPAQAWSACELLRVMEGFRS